MEPDARLTGVLTVYNKSDLDNGLRIITERIEHVKSASVGIWVNVGSRDERAGEEGISHLLEHMIFKGTSRRTALQIAKEIDQVGGMSNAFTSKELTCFHAKVMSDHLPMVTDLLTDIFLESLFNKDDLEKERQVILQEIRMVEDTPDELVHILFSKNLWPEDTVGKPVMGTVESVSSITPEDIRDYIDRTYKPPRIVISATGDIEHQRIVDLMGPAFSSIPAGDFNNRKRIPHVASGMHIAPKKLEQAHLCLGAEFPSILDQSRYIAAILNIILGGNMSSRLFQEIREKRGLAYSVYSFFSAYIDTGMLGIYAGIDPSQTTETIAVILKELAEFREGRIEPAELKAAQEHLKGSIVLGSESIDNRMTRLAKNELTYKRYVDFDEVIEAINNVTIDQVVDLSRRYLEPGCLNMTLLGPVKEEDIPQDILIEA